MCQLPACTATYCNPGSGPMPCWGCTGQGFDSDMGGYIANYDWSSGSPEIVIGHYEQVSYTDPFADVETVVVEDRFYPDKVYDSWADSFRDFILSPEGLRVSADLRNFGNATKETGNTGVKLFATVGILSAVTGQPEGVAIGAAGVTTSEVITQGGNLTLEISSWMESVQQNSSAPLVAASMQGAIDQIEPTEVLGH